MTLADDGPRPAPAAHRTSCAPRYDQFRGRGLALDMTRGKPCPEQLDLSLGNARRPGPRLQSRRRHRLPQLRRPRGAARGARAVRRAARGRAGRGHRRRQLQPRADARRDRAVPAQGHARRAAVAQSARGEIPLSEPRLRSPFRDLRALRHQDAPHPDGTRRPGHRLGRAAGRTPTPHIKGMWIVPRYSNPSGVVCTPRVVERLAQMPTAASDFRIFWDNAYAVHHLVDDPPPLANILTACRAAGEPDRPIIFTSTSKISFAGAGVGVVAGSPTNIRHLLAGLSIQTIGHDKLNQLRHVRFFRDAAGVAAHMRKHAAILKPKFDAVTAILHERLGGKGIADLERAAGRLLRQPRHARPLRDARRAARRRGRRQADQGGRDLPAWQGSARPQHPPRPELSVAGADQAGDGAGGDLCRTGRAGAGEVGRIAGALPPTTDPTAAPVREGACRPPLRTGGAGARPLYVALGARSAHGRPQGGPGKTVRP